MNDALTGILWAMTSFSGTALGLSLVGGFIWWIVRRKRERVWFPMLRIFNQSRRKFPRLQLRPPRWLPFLCFVGIAAALFILSGEPKRKIFKQSGQKFNREHFFIDLSPSVSAYTNVKELQQLVVDVFKKANQSGQTKFSVSFSGRDDIYYMNSADELVTQLQGIDFHRFGTRIGRSLEAQLKNLGQVDLIYVFSDADAFSWEGFNWRFLSERAPVRFVDVRQGRGVPHNLFISYAKATPIADNRVYEWNVEISRRDREGTDSGNLSLLVGSRIATQVDWQIAAEQISTDITVTVPSETIDRMLKETGASEFQWRLTTNDESRDRLFLDNDFRLATSGHRRNVLIVAEPGGERFIEDPTYHLQLAMEAQGMSVRRIDSIKTFDVLKGYDFVMAMGGSAQGEEAYCPIDLVRVPLPPQQIVHVWVAPLTANANYQSLCRCLSQISGQYESNKLGHCANVSTPMEWAEFPKSIGAKKIGGSVGDQLGIAWNYRYQQPSGGQVEILSFNMPMTPSTMTGILHSRLPLIVRDLINWQDDTAAIANRTWPRLSSNVGVDMAQDPRFVLSNVPQGESIGSVLEKRLLPSAMSPQDGTPLHLSMASQENMEDAISWIYALLGFALLLSAVEVTASLWQRWRKSEAIRVDVWIAAGFAIWLALGSTARSEVNIAVVSSHIPSFNRLAKELAFRTSIDLSPDAAIPGKALFDEPWLWVSDITQFSNPQKMANLGLWIKRGGFLVLQGDVPASFMPALSKVLQPKLAWETIPADHELMRSFYLLKVLPNCGERVWRGIHFDGRLAVLNVPFDILRVLADTPSRPNCLPESKGTEEMVRIFVNTIMVALATDYKKDQVHLPEILKRLR